MADSDTVFSALAGRSVTVRKVSARGEQVFAYPGVIGVVFGAGVRVDAEWTRARMELGYTTFEPGDRFTEWFYTDRWYNVMEVRESGGALKGWYCNIARPATITPDSVSYSDLTLDLWVSPDGATLTLDEDDFEADAELSAGERAHARAGMAALRSHVRAREAPFDIITGAGASLLR
jgi:predicted RNA-binding protein associated with RNAse of E/G family